MFKKIGNKIIRFIKDNRASPLVEEGLLIGLAIILFVVIVTVVDQIVNWINSLAENLPN